MGSSNKTLLCLLAREVLVEGSGELEPLSLFINNEKHSPKTEDKWGDFYPALAIIKAMHILLPHQSKFRGSQLKQKA